MLTYTECVILEREPGHEMCPLAKRLRAKGSTKVLTSKNAWRNKLVESVSYKGSSEYVQCTKEGKWTATQWSRWGKSHGYGLPENWTEKEAHDLADKVGKAISREWGEYKVKLSAALARCKAGKPDPGNVFDIALCIREVIGSLEVDQAHHPAALYVDNIDSAESRRLLALVKVDMATKLAMIRTVKSNQVMATTVAECLGGYGFAGRWEAQNRWTSSTISMCGPNWSIPNE